METLQAIATRHSIRSFLDKPVPEELIRSVLSAGMSGPSAVNARPWAFLVVTDREMLNKMADGNGRAAQPLRQAAFGILVCGDLDRAIPKVPDYWTVDATIAAQNMVLAAHDLGLGCVWLGTWPQEEKVTAQARLFHLPKTIIPHSILAFGYPAEEKNGQRDLYEPDRVHFEAW